MKEHEMNGFLDRGTTFKGDLAFEDLLRIDGRFEGTIRSESALIVGEGAEITGEIMVDSVTINGRVDGTVRAKSRVEINSNARVSGELHTPVLAIQEGALFDGTVQMQGDAKPSKPDPKGKAKSE